MLIPESFRVGIRRYKIVFKERSDRYAGLINYVLRRVVIYKWYAGRTRSQRQQAEVFWHEVTHAILYDMGHPLWRNESFVEEFSKRLNEVCHTAKVGK